MCSRQTGIALKMNLTLVYISFHHWVYLCMTQGGCGQCAILDVAVYIILDNGMGNVCWE